MIDVLFVWHMHQPRYVHPATGRPVLPWLRLHACSGYLDMARALERNPEARVTVNFVPSLVEQLEAMLGGAKDALELVAERPTDSLDDDERRLVIERSFSVCDTEIAMRRRYAELRAKRGHERMTTRDLCDLQCLFLLGWLGFAAREDNPEIAELDAKERDYDEADKALLLAIVRRSAAAVLPAWKRLAQAGRVELSTSPFYHPIVPLLIDSAVARRCQPTDPLPEPFRHPEDAREQILRARHHHVRTFGIAPTGMWPPEGCLSPEAVALYGECGVRWLAGDSETLARSLGEGAPARAHAAHYRYANVDLVFRDRDLSDRIGFHYANLATEVAVDDLVRGALCVAEPNGLAVVALDGENPWERYPGRGGPFLDALYRRLASETKRGRMRAVTVTRMLEERGPGRALERIHSGSWIAATYRIWIGDAVKNRAWEELRRARAHLRDAEARLGASHGAVEVAREHLLVAEGSDWFWWFGEPNSSAEDTLYDELFRAHLAAAYRALGDGVPEALARPLA